LLLVEINAHTVATIVAMMGNATCTNGCCRIGTITTSFVLLRRYVKRARRAGGFTVVM